MPFHIPKLDEFRSIEKWQEDYEKLRATKDSQRWFSAIRPATRNVERDYALQFIKNVEQNVMQNKNDYSSYDPKFKNADHIVYSTKVVPFLKQAMAGACLLVLTDIDEEYYLKVNANFTALAEVILNFFGCKEISDIEATDQEPCFKALKQYMATISAVEKRSNKQHPEKNTVWHPSLSNKEVVTKIDNRLTQIKEATASMSCS